MYGSTNTKSIEFIWKIPNLSQQRLTNGPGKFITSRAFSIDCEGAKVFLLLYPQGYVQSGDTEVTIGEKWTSVFLQAESSKKYDTSHHFELSILDADGEKFVFCHFHRKIPFFGGNRNFVRLTDLENPAYNLLPNDTLTIRCRVEETQSEYEGVCNCQIEQPQTAHNRRKLCEDLTSTTANQYADFVFKVENEKIAAHKVILAVRSPVFAAMFQHEMQENRTNETEITDVTLAAFKALLRFIYTGHCEVENLAEQLLIAANKYDIPELKQICEKELLKKLTADNAVHLFILSDLHQANDLKDGVMRFINRNAPAVMKTPFWSNFSKSHPILVTELYNKLFE